jgi:hypothetical protein
VRAVWVGLGAALLVVGAVFVFVPITPYSTSFAGVPAHCFACEVPYQIYSSDGILPTYTRLSWSSPAPVTVYAITFTSAPSACDLVVARGWAQLEPDCGVSRTLANTTGTSGSVALTIPAGATLLYLAVSFDNSTPTVLTTLTGALPLQGIAFAGLGVGAVLLGVLPWSRLRKSAPSAPENAEAPP